MKRFHKQILFLFLLSMTGSLYGQNNIKSVLNNIERNNRTLISETQKIKALRSEFRTGLFIYDPVVSYDFLKGSPSSIGNQTEFSITQQFDFPSVYGFKNTISDLRIVQTNFQRNSTRQDILLEAKLVIIRLIYLNKRKAELIRRLNDARKFYSDYKIKFEKEDVSILDLNKANLLLINIETDLKLLEAELAEFNQKLIELNGGIPITFNDTIYPPIPDIPVFETLVANVETNDSELKYLQMQRQIGQAQISLSRSNWLPKLEIGYRYQGLLDQRYHGVHLNISIPLWENKNRVTYQQLQISFYDSQIQEHKNKYYFEIKQLYEKYKSFDTTLTEYKSNIQTLINTDLLNKSLEAGQINTLQYYTETFLVYDTIDKYLQIEYEYQLLLARLYKFAL